MDMDKVLLSRNIDVKSLSKEDFVNLLYEDFLKAVENHKDILDIKWKRESRKSS